MAAQSRGSVKVFVHPSGAGTRSSCPNHPARRPPASGPLDPASWAVLERCLDQSEAQRTDNPHVMVTRQTKSGRGQRPPPI